MEKIMNKIKKERLKLSCNLNKNRIMHFLSVVDEVEETNILLEFEIITTEELEKAYDGYFLNKLQRYEHLKQLIGNFIDSILEGEVKELSLVEKIFQFKKEYVFSIR